MTTIERFSAPFKPTSSATGGYVRYQDHLAAVKQAKADQALQVAGGDAAAAAIEFGVKQLNAGDLETFLCMWNEGEFDNIREWFPEAPEAVFIGVDPLHPGTKALSKQDQSQRQDGGPQL